MADVFGRLVLFLFIIVSGELRALRIYSIRTNHPLTSSAVRLRVTYCDFKLELQPLVGNTHDTCVERAAKIVRDPSLGSYQTGKRKLFASCIHHETRAKWTGICRTL